MFWKRLGLLGFLLTTLVAHLIFGQDHNQGLLVICFGNNGHVAMEALDVSEPVQNAPHCDDTQTCHDIILALDHDDPMVLPGATRDWEPLHEAAYTLQRFLTPYLAEDTGATLTLARLRSNAPPDFGVPIAVTAQHETLNHTILLI